jgi:FKBP-type peptidyl-prolyl cis-trans isomerase SlyD
MKVGKDKVVTLTYTLRYDNEDGDVIQKVDTNRPFVHLFGIGTLLPAFEENLSGLQAGDDFKFYLKSDEAYGDSSEEAILELDKSMFEIDSKIDEEFVAVGKSIAMQDQDGHPVDGIVLAIKDDKVIMDFNHPLAGENLFFSGQITEVRDATDEELSHGHVHGPDRHNH